ncbi:hypothetical protein [Solimonas terrae]|uniref:Uncharacterized protein n=1 Tax=Solimonas terrae TaxID=1396819 RepID=A0A6M2BRP2_9GAMM|nr:hypothetical protein [Solimonas terrae]NGY04881.1 hypothetical protein [Solimonas terrae]
MQNREWPRRTAIAAALAVGFGGSAFAAPGDPLGPSQTLVPPGTGDYNLYPAIARDAAGDGVVVWKGSGILAQRVGADGTPKGNAFVVDPTPYAGPPDVAMDDDGDFVVTWAQLHVADTTGVYAQRYHADGSPNGAQLKVAAPPDATVGDSYILSPSVAMDDAGDFVVAWAQGRELKHGSWYSCSYGIGICTQVGAYAVQMRRYTGGGTQAQVAQTVDSTGGVDVEVLAVPLVIGSDEGRVGVAMAPDGRFVVAWDHESEGVSLLSGVYARAYDADGKAGLKRVVSSQRDQGVPDVAMSAGGAYVVTYNRASRARNDYSEGIYLRRFPAGNGLGSAEVRVDSDTNAQAYGLKTSVAMDAAGDTVVAWPVGGRIHAQRYANGGGALGINFDVGGAPPNEYGSFVSPDVAMAPGGDFAVAWGAIWADYSSGPAGVTYTSIDTRYYDGP